MKKRSKKKQWIFFVLILLGIGGAVTYALRPQDSARAVTAETASTGDITSIVTAAGKVHPVVQVRISSEVSGEIVELPVRDGQRVERGDLLARVDPRTLEAQVAQQEASLRATRATSAQSRAQALQSELDLNRLQDLFERGFATREQIDLARTRVEIDRASHEAAQYRIEQQEMLLREARDLLNKTTIHAPMTGTITSLRAEVGDRVVGTAQFEGTEIMRIANLDTMEVRVDVSESNITDVRIGQRAYVDVDAFPDLRLIGKVTEIANAAVTTQERTQEQLTTFLVRILLEDPPAGLRPGMTATADIETQTVTGVVRVPIQSVTVRSPEVIREALDEPAPGEDADLRGGENRNATGARRRGRGERLERVVFVIKDGVAEIRRVETGIADNRFLEITSGLSVGEKVVTGGHNLLTRELEHGQAVRVTESAMGARPGAS
jgi:HlyD family secretion protein